MIPTTGTGSKLVISLSGSLLVLSVKWILSYSVTILRLTFKGSRTLKDFLLCWEYELLLLIFEDPRRIERSVWGVVWAIALEISRLVADLVLFLVVCVWS